MILKGRENEFLDTVDDFTCFMQHFFYVCVATI